MKFVKRQRLKPEVRRQKLVEAAERLLKARGPSVRVEDVAREARAAKGTFYLYFPAWDDLLETIRSGIFGTFVEANPLPDEIAGPAWPAVLERQAVAGVNAIVEMGGLHEAIFHSDFAARRPMSADKHPAGRLAAMIRAGQEAGAFAGLDPEPTGRLLFAVVHETADAIAAGADRDRALAAMRLVLRRILSAE